jgi:hypothetical protein
VDYLACGLGGRFNLRFVQALASSAGWDRWATPPDFLQVWQHPMEREKATDWPLGKRSYAEGFVKSWLRRRVSC